MSSTSSAGLPPDAVARAVKEARKEGVFAGLTAALASALIGAKAFRFKRNPTLACGTIAGVLSGYLFAEAFKDTHIATLQRELQKKDSQEEQAGFSP